MIAPKREGERCANYTAANRKDHKNLVPPLLEHQYGLSYSMKKQDIVH